MKYMLKAILTVMLFITVIVFTACDGGSESTNSGSAIDQSGVESLPRITINGSRFLSGGKPIFMNGANTPWQHYEDFGGDFDADWWAQHFSQFNANGLNSTRVWISCYGKTSIINIDSDGYVSGASEEHWSDLDDYFEIAQDNGVYVMATLITHNHFNGGKHPSSAPRWLKWIQSDANIDSYIENYLIPFVKRYGDNTALWSIDLMNEPAWVTKKENENNLIEFEQIQMFFAKAARAVHENSNILVTVGSSDIKYNSDVPGNGRVGNMVSDVRLRAQVDDPNATLDFWSPHWYEWTKKYMGTAMFQTPAEYGLDDSKPSVVGETPAIGSTVHDSLALDIEASYLNGWAGILPWSSVQVDDKGGWNELSEGAAAFAADHQSVVFPHSPDPIPNN